MGAWIETLRIVRRSTRRTVAPHMGAWIETRATLAFICVWSMSLPTWERGLKLLVAASSYATTLSLPTWERGLKRTFLGTAIFAVVAPHMGAWIETLCTCLCCCCECVAPHMGAWIETGKGKGGRSAHESLPTWERGLKLIYNACARAARGRSPHGSVD